MRNLKITIEYDGTRYAGWQVQNSRRIRKSPRQRPTIQATIEKALRKILQEKIRLIGSGRTDAGVHALGQVANFATKTKISLYKLQWALNGNLPDDIVIRSIEKPNPDFHSRFDARSKVYRYAILNRPYPSAFLRNRVYFYRHPLDVRLMQQEARALLGRHDFKAFQATDKKERSSVRTIKKISIRNETPTLCLVPCTLLIIDIEADGFLYNMVRNIVGTLIEIGRGKFPRGNLKKILASKNRKLAGPTVPACGLCLSEVKY